MGIREKVLVSLFCHGGDLVRALTSQISVPKKREHIRRYVEKY